MYKINHTRKGRSSSQFRDRSNNRAKKEGSLKVTAKRLTIPPGLYSLGISSGFVQRSRSPQHLNNDCTPRRNSQGPSQSNINANEPQPRRSSRISKQTHHQTPNVEVAASSYYLDDPEEQNSAEIQEKVDKVPHKGILKRNISKSIFKEIDKRYARVQAENRARQESLKNPAPNKAEVVRGTSFCRTLYKESRVETKTDQLFQEVRSRIAEKIENLNRALSGERAAIQKMMAEQRASPDKKNSGMESDEEFMGPFDYFQKCEWVYDTPPRQKIAVPRIDECAIKPAIVCTNKQQSSIYELNPNVKIDTNKLANNNVEIDGRYMWHVASFDNNLPMDLGFCRLGNQPESDGGAFGGFQDRQGCSTSQFHPGNPFMDLPQNYAVPMPSRPTKSTAKAPRQPRIFKRKLDELGSTPAGPNAFNDETFNGDITVINDDGNFRIVSQQRRARDSEFDFQYKRNLFEVAGERNVFNFPKDDNLFDFSQLKNNN